MTTDAAGRLAERIRRHAAACARGGTPLYAALMAGMADDLETGGPIAAILAGQEDAPPGHVLQLRILGGLHRIVLDGRAPELAPYYRTVGGTRPPDFVWPVARGVLAGHVAELRAALDRPPQTNEVGRSAALLVGLCATGAREVRLLEVGASAGLNLRVDHFRLEGSGCGIGPVDSPVHISDAFDGLPGPVPNIVARGGCDRFPIDPATEDGRRRLLSFVWPDHEERVARLRGALEVAARVPAQVDAADAADWLSRALAPAPVGEVLTVVWHSIVWQYLDPAARAAAEAVIADAGRRGPLAHLALEFPDQHTWHPPELRLTMWPLGESRVIATTGDHGPPVRLHPGGN